MTPTLDSNPGGSTRTPGPALRHPNGAVSEPPRIREAASVARREHPTPGPARRNAMRCCRAGPHPEIGVDRLKVGRSTVGLRLVGDEALAWTLEAARATAECGQSEPRSPSGVDRSCGIGSGC